MLYVHFLRQQPEFIIHYILGLFVIISLVSFLVPPQDVNARIALLITTLLVLVTVFNGVIDNSPKAREGPTALGLWMFSMLLFVFAAFMFNCVTMLQRRRKDIGTSAPSSSMKPGLLPMVIDNKGADLDIGDAEVATKGYVKKSKSNLVDFVTLGLLLTLFVIYIVVYVYFFY